MVTVLPHATTFPAVGDWLKTLEPAWFWPVNPGTGPASETRLAAADISKTSGTIAYASRHSHSTKAQQNYYYNEYHEGISEISNSLLKMLLNQMVDNTMVAAVKEK
jgi:hypothetical protein